MHQGRYSPLLDRRSPCNSASFIPPSLQQRSSGFTVVYQPGLSPPLHLHHVKPNVSKPLLGHSLTIDKLLGNHLHLHQVQEGSCRPRNLTGHPTTQGFLAASYGMVCLYGHIHHVLCRWLQRLCTRELGCPHVPFLVSPLIPLLLPREKRERKKED